MRAVVQRASRAAVRAGSGPVGALSDDDLELTGEIGRGLVAFVGVTHGDDVAAATRLAGRIANLRVFPDEQGAMNLSCLDVGGEVLVVSQFTLYADTRRGRRPSYVAAARPEAAEPLVDAVTDELRGLGLGVATGRFGAHMRVEVVGDGPVTLLLEV